MSSPIPAPPLGRCHSFHPGFLLRPFGPPSAPIPTPPSSSAPSIPYPPGRSFGPFLLLATLRAPPFARPSFGFSQSTPPPPSFGPSQGMPPPLTQPPSAPPRACLSPSAPPCAPTPGIKRIWRPAPPPSWAIPSFPPLVGRSTNPRNTRGEEMCF